MDKWINFMDRWINEAYTFFGGECSDLGVGGWVSSNLNIVRMCKSVRNIG